MVKPGTILSIAGLAAVAVGAYFVYTKIKGSIPGFTPGIPGISGFPNPFIVEVPVSNVPDLTVHVKGERASNPSIIDPSILNKESSTVVYANGSSLQRSFGLSAPLGMRKDIQGVRGNPLAPTAISRTQPTYTGVLSTSQGTRAIAGSQALFDRLANNLRTSSNRQVTQAKLNTAVNTSQKGRSYR